MSVEKYKNRLNINEDKNQIDVSMSITGRKE